MKITFLLISLFIAQVSTASTDVISSFCHELYKFNDPKVADVGLSTILSFKFRLKRNPKALVEMVKHQEAPRERNFRRRVKFIISNLKVQSFTDLDRTAWDAFQEEVDSAQNQMKESPLKQVLKEVKTKELCTEVISSNTELVEMILGYNDIFQRHQDLIKKYQAYQAYKDFSDLKPWLKRKKWILYEGLNPVQVHRLIADARPDDLLFVSHAGPSGKIYDSFKNSYPKGFFHNLASSTHNIILFNCFGKESVNYYGLNELKEKVRYFYPQTKSQFSFAIESDKTPIISLKGIKEVRLKFVKKPSLKACSIKLDGESDDYGVFLNGYFMGPVLYENEFPCDLLKSTKNQLEIYSVLSTSDRSGPEVSEATINGEIFPVKSIHSRFSGRHIVSRVYF